MSGTLKMKWLKEKYDRTRKKREWEREREKWQRLKQESNQKTSYYT